MMGKRQMLPMPTAEPIQARVKPHWPLNPSRLGKVSWLIDKILLLISGFLRSGPPCGAAAPHDEFAFLLGYDSGKA